MSLNALAQLTTVIMAVVGLLGWTFQQGRIAQKTTSVLDTLTKAVEKLEKRLSNLERRNGRPSN